MLHISSHKERVAKVKTFTSKNKLFSIIAVIIAVFLLGNLITNRINRQAKDQVPVEQHTSDQSQIEKDESQSQQDHWRFYWTDFWILVIGGGFCSVMILKERKKAKENLK